MDNELTELQKKYLENTLCTFIFGLIGVVIPIYLFSVISLNNARKHKFEKLAKLHRIGEVLGYIGLVESSVLIIVIALYNWFA